MTRRRKKCRPRHGDLTLPGGGTSVGLSAQNGGTWLGPFAAGANLDRYLGLGVRGRLHARGHLTNETYGDIAQHAYWAMRVQGRLTAGIRLYF